MEYEEDSLMARIRSLPADGCGDQALRRLLSAAAPMKSFADLEKDLPPKARYLGPGRWLEAIRELSQERA